MKKRKIIISLVALLGLVYFAIVQIVPDEIEKSKNKLKETPPYIVSNEAKTLYNSLDFIADLHCDALLWNRDLSKKSNIGHVDFPRMQEVNVAMQAFTIVTKSPKGQGFKNTKADGFDMITFLNIVQGRPLSNWFSFYDYRIPCIRFKYLVSY